MPAQSKLETLPPELVFTILSYLTHPSSRLPGLTETQSEYDYPREKKKKALKAYHLDLTAPPDYPLHPHRIMQLMQWSGFPHPFNVLAATSPVLRDLVETYCAHLVVTNNRFNLPILQVQENGSQAVYPDMSGIVYRRLWLQYAPRHCFFCKRLMHEYPHRRDSSPVQACQDCSQAQVLIVNEVEEQYHISRSELLAHNVHGAKVWVLRADVENLALEFYGTKTFHDHRGERQQCAICLKKGTLARIMRVREQREAQSWQPLEGTGGWIVERKRQGDEDEMDVDEEQEEGESRKKKIKWVRYHAYLKNLYLYREDEFDAGYNLQAYTP